MADESADTGLPGLPTSVAETEPDWGGLVDKGDRPFQTLEDQFLYGSVDEAEPESDAEVEDSTQEQASDPEGESDTEEASTDGETATENDGEDDEDGEEEEEGDEEVEDIDHETAEEKLARLERENQELKKQVSSRSRKASPSERQAQRITELEQRLQHLAQEREQAQRLASLKPYHPDHPEHQAYLQKKQRVEVWSEMIREMGNDEDGLNRVHRAMARQGLTEDDVSLVREGSAYEAEQARRFATDPMYRRQIIARDYEALRNEEVQREQQIARSRSILEDPHNQELMNQKYPDKFNELWEGGHTLDYIFEHLQRLEVVEELKNTKAAKNRAKASAKAKSDLDKRKATSDPETGGRPAERMYAIDAADAVEKAYKEKYGREFVVSRPDCIRFMDEYLADSPLIT